MEVIDLQRKLSGNTTGHSARIRPLQTEPGIRPVEPVGQFGEFTGTVIAVQRAAQDIRDRLVTSIRDRIDQAWAIETTGELVSPATPKEQSTNA